MTKTSLHLFIVAVITTSLFMAGCKKNTPSIIGTWTFSNISSTETEVQSDTDTIYNASGICTITSSPPLNTVTEKTVYNTPGYNNDTIAISPYSLTIAINSDGSYSMTEAYTYAGSATTSTTTGTWEYFSNNKSNDNISFSDGGSVLLGGGYIDNYYFGVGESVFTISSLSSNKLILGFNGTYKSSNPAYSVTEAYNVAVAFTR